SVEAAELADRPASAAAGPAGGARLLGVHAVIGRAAALGLLHDAQAISVAAVNLRRHRDPRVVHAERQEDLLAGVGAVVASVQPADDLAEDEPARVEVIA